MNNSAGKSNRVDEVVVLGHGFSGLITGLCLKKLRSDLRVRLIGVPERRSEGVGKSTFYAILHVLFGFLELDRLEFIRRVKPVWKTSVFFRDWGEGPDFHFPFDNSLIRPPLDDSDYLVSLKQMVGDQDRVLPSTRMFEDHKTPFVRLEGGGYGIYNNVAYNMNDDGLLEHLRGIASDWGVDAVEDRIETVRQSRLGIDSLQGRSGDVYEADLYVDCSGFNRLLTSPMGVDYRCFNQPLNRAVVGKHSIPLERVEPATVVKSDRYGWLWQIDTLGERDRGYVFSDRFASTTEVVDRFVEVTSSSIDRDSLDTYRFRSDYCEQAWTKNCVAIGDAQGFVEPLQSTGTTMAALAAQNLAAYLQASGWRNRPAIRSEYNTYTKRAWQTVYDFLLVHYKFTDQEGETWDQLNSLPWTERSRTIHEKYQSLGITKIETITNNLFSEIPTPEVFEPLHFQIIMASLGAESGFYEDGGSDRRGDPPTEYVRRFSDRSREFVRYALDYEQVYHSDFLDELDDADVRFIHEI